jgi:Cu+-exporting ATPase
LNDDDDEEDELAELGSVDRCVLAISGMTCADCALKLEHTIGGLEGVESVRVSFVSGKATVLHDNVDVDTFIACAQRIGFDASILSRSASATVSTTLCVPARIGPPESLVDALHKHKGLVHAEVVPSPEPHMGYVAVEYDPAVTGLRSLIRSYLKLNHLNDDAEEEEDDEDTAFGGRDDIRLIQRSSMSTNNGPIGGKKKTKRGNVRHVRFSDDDDDDDQHQLDAIAVSIPNNGNNGSSDKKLSCQSDLDGIGGITVAPTINSTTLGALHEAHLFRIRLLLSVVLFVPTVFFAYVHTASMENEIVPGLSTATLLLWLLATPMQSFVAWPLYVNAWKAARYARTATMDTLIVLSTTVVYFYSVGITLAAVSGSTFLTASPLFETSTVLLTLVVASRWAELRARRRASKAIDQLHSKQAREALLVVADGDGDGDTALSTLETIGVDFLQRGDTVRVGPGGMVPSDGIVVRGESEVDESMLTGESIPVLKEPRAADASGNHAGVASKSKSWHVHGGTTNLTGTLDIRITREIHENTLTRITQLIEEAQSRKARIQLTADRIAAWFIPAVLVASTLVFVVWFAVASSGVYTPPTGESPVVLAMLFALTFLVVSCPCAFALSAPTVFVVATAVASRFGILFRGGDLLESASRCDLVVFDKTGTLTEGKPKVVGGTPALSLDDRVCLVSAERNSEHAVGKALVAFASQGLDEHEAARVQSATVTGFRVIAGCGIECTVEGKYKVHVGSIDWLMEEGIVADRSQTTQSVFADARQASNVPGATVVGLVVDARLVGVFALLDQPRVEAAQVVRQLHDAGREVWIVSGDSQEAADTVAESVGVPLERCMGGVRPAGKAELVSRMQQQQQEEGKRRMSVMMVGDGLNDAPALAQADVGVAMGTGTDVAIEAADVTLARAHLGDVVTVIDIARSAMLRVRLNFLWAISYNIIAMLIASGVLYVAAGVRLPPAWAGATELLSSVPVILFSLLMYRYTPPAGAPPPFDQMVAEKQKTSEFTSISVPL